MKETFCVLNDMCIVCSDVKINCLVLGDLLVALTWGKFLSQFLGLKKASGDDEIKYYLWSIQHHIWLRVTFPEQCLMGIPNALTSLFNKGDFQNLLNEPIRSHLNGDQYRAGMLKCREQSFWNGVWTTTLIFIEGHKRAGGSATETFSKWQTIHQG